MSDYSHNPGFLAQHGLALGPPVVPVKANDMAVQTLRHESGLQVQAAVGPAEVADAHALVASRYAWRGYAQCAPQSQGRALTLIAKMDEKTVGTVTVRFDSAAGLLLDGAYGAEANRFREKGRSICEVTRLATDPEADSRTVLGMLFHLTYLACHWLYDMTDMFIEINPRHQRFYSQGMDFKVAADPRVCPRVHAPAVLLHLDLSTARPDLWLRPLLTAPLALAA